MSLRTWCCFLVLGAVWPAQDSHPALPGGGAGAELYRAQMAAAEYAIRLSDHPVAREWLEATDPARRGFEWRVHAAGLDEALAHHRVDGGHATALCCSPDGALLACGTSKGRLELRRTEDGHVVRAVAAHDDEISQVRFDRKGDRVVTTSHDRKVRVFAVADLTRLLEFSGHGFPVGGADFSPDGTLIASAGYERPPGTVVGTVHIWNAADGTILRTMTGGRKPLVNLAFSPDGKFVASPSWDFCLFVWPTDGGEPRKLAVPDEGIYNAADGVAWSPDGRFIAAASKDKTARVFSVESGEIVASLRGHRDAVTKLQFAPGGSLLATTSSDGTLRLWNTTSWEMTAELRGHAHDVLDLAFSSDGSRLFSASLDGGLCVWDPRCTWYGRTPMHATQAAYTCRWSPDGHRVATCSFDGRVQIWCADTQVLLASFAAHAKSCHMLEWTSDGRHLITGSYDATVRVFDATTLAEQSRFTHTEGLYWLRVSPDGRTIAVCSGKQVLVLERATLRLVHTFAGHAAGVQTVTFSRDSARCISCGRDGKALIWEAASGTLLATIAAPRPDVAEASFSEDGSQVIVATRSGLVRLHGARDGALQKTLVRNRNGLDHFDLCPGGRRIALASTTVVIVDVVDGGVVGSFRPHLDRSYHTAWDPRGERLATCSTDKSIAILDPRPLRDRLTAKDATLSTRATVAPRLAERLASGASLSSIAEAVRQDGTMTDATRAAWLALVTEHAGKKTANPEGVPK